MKNELLELEILKHVEETPRLSNRMAAAKLGCSVKLAHALLGKMVDRGLLHVKKLHSRRWDYFLTPKGISEKARLTFEFLEFSFQFYHEARRESSKVCRRIAEEGRRDVAFLGAGDLAEIVYLGVREWGLKLVEVYDGDTEGTFLGHRISSRAKLPESKADAIIVCLYDRDHPMSLQYLPNDLEETDNMYWVFNDSSSPEPEAMNAPQAPEIKVDTGPLKKRIRESNKNISPKERMEQFRELQKNAFRYMSESGYRRYIRRNMKQRAMHP